ncbi:hypothetical protein So717_01550 [Roseobacter cerasinus]|uniref:Phosphomannomutase n=1 Tax=Roseobacter cerasinus TaxID=2602289 RepID=A0A640VL22_9RHOB|nr:hypothetical protein [Roseobacter cerasinus]GFE48402.1 hypothetical protein So717_01550 [Roseobacter cerasinus]
MFTIEHEFDATVVTLVDDGTAPLEEDVTVHVTESAILLNQYDARSDRTVSIRLSPEQWRDLTAALDLPEGVYRAT